MEVIHALKKTEQFHLEKMETIETEEMAIEQEMAEINALLEDLIAERDITEKRQHFIDVLWPRIQARSHLPEHRNPFSNPDHFDANEVKSRLSFLASAEQNTLSSHGRTLQRSIYHLNHTYQIGTTFHREDPKKRMVQNQRTGWMLF